MTPRPLDEIAAAIRGETQRQPRSSELDALLLEARQQFPAADRFYSWLYRQGFDARTIAFALDPDAYVPKVDEGRRHTEDNASDLKAKRAKSGGAVLVDGLYAIGGREEVDPWDAHHYAPAKVRQTPSRSLRERLQRRCLTIEEYRVLTEQDALRRAQAIAEAQRQKAERAAEAEREATERAQRKRQAKVFDPPQPREPSNRPVVRLDPEDLATETANTVDDYRYYLNRDALKWWEDEGTEDDDLTVDLTDALLFDDDLDPPQPVTEPAVDDRPICSWCGLRPREKNGKGNGWRELCSACRKQRTRGGELPDDQHLRRARRRAAKERHYQAIDAADIAERRRRTVEEDEKRLAGVGDIPR